jgi:hypothetical protein
VGTLGNKKNKSRALRDEHSATVPVGLAFEDLELQFDPHLGEIKFATDVLRKVADRSDLDWTWLLADSDRVIALLLGWYKAHKEDGGMAIRSAEQLEAFFLDTDPRPTVH